ncbi:MAG: hypothetical protein E6H66_14930 [Betaproteobacteria bacterium]|nr:MAG: hypothetical protein E6H66_14930 [Betaproteobacteria bacterium]
MHTASHPLGYPVYDRAHGSWVVPWLFDRHHASHSRRAITVCNGGNGRRGISRIAGRLHESVRSAVVRSLLRIDLAAAARR